MDLALGMKDGFPREVGIKRKIENILRALFRKWGYQEVEPPSIEYYSTLEKALGEEIKERLFKFIDREGKLVCLRPEFTTSIARMYSSEFLDITVPVRVFYDGKIFRYPSSPFRTECEFTQVGVESLGQNSVSIDAEIVALAISSLQGIGIQDFQVDISHVGVYQGILDSLDLDKKIRESIHSLVGKKDFTGLKEIIKNLSLPHPKVGNLLIEFPFLRGKIDVVDHASSFFDSNQKILATFNRIKEIWNILVDFGLERHVVVNLGLVRDFDYYTGLIFEGFSPLIGYPLLAGGRYDNLFSLFGKDLPACGFALFAERLVEIMAEVAFSSSPTTPISIQYPPRLRAKVFSISENFRQKGIPIIMEEKPKDSPYLTIIGTKGTFDLKESEWGKIEEIIEREQEKHG